MKYICSVYADFLKGKLDKVKNKLNIHIIRYQNGYQVSGIPNQSTCLNKKDMHLWVISYVKTILLLYYNHGILKKSLNRSRKEGTVS